MKNSTYDHLASFSSLESTFPNFQYLANNLCKHVMTVAIKILLISIYKPITQHSLQKKSNIWLRICQLKKLKFSLSKQPIY